MAAAPSLAIRTVAGTMLNSTTMSAMSVEVATIGGGEDASGGADARMAVGGGDTGNRRWWDDDCDGNNRKEWR